MDVVGYLRVSTGGQAANGHGLDAQRAAITREADHRGWSVTWVEDAGHSAKSLRRPGVQRALDLLQRGEAEALVVAKLDRLSRSLADVADVLRASQRAGWSFICLDPNVDTSTAAGEALIGMVAVFAQWERRMTSERTRDALAAAQAKGIRVGRPRTTPPDVLARVVAQRMAGATLAAIADALNRDGVPTAQGGRRWQPGTVRALLVREGVA